MKMDWGRLLSEQRTRGHTGASSAQDPRNEFQKDYHRIIGSASFRRLQDKTQVFPLDNSDFVRTRLTHSLEVASFAKSLGQMIFLNLMRSGADPEITEDVMEKSCSVLECAGLVHDIGNPPFGHFGEDFIRSWFEAQLPQLRFQGRPLTEVLRAQQIGDLCHFEGNAQALRLLTKLHFLVDKNGMNLNYTLLNTIIKYPVSSLEINKKSGNIKDKKMGYYCAETLVFEAVTAATGAVGCRHPLAFILEAADDIAYKTADIEDAVKKGCLSYAQLLEALKSACYAEKCTDDSAHKVYSMAVERLERLMKQARDRGISDPEQNAVQNWSIYVQGLLLRCATNSFAAHYAQIMDGTFPMELLASSAGGALADALGDIAYRFAFQSKAILKLEIAAGSIFDFLLTKFVHAALDFDTDARLTALNEKLMGIVSENYVRAYRTEAEGKDAAEKLYLRLLLVTDFICGMTDGYAKRLYQELSGIAQ